MAQFPAMPLWTDAYLADTTHLSTIEHGAYFLLLVAMWRAKNHRLPNDDVRLARYAKMTAGQWNRVRGTIMEFFTVDGEWITQGRLTDEATAVRQRSVRQSNRAMSRWLKNNNTDDATAVPHECQTDASHIHNHIHKDTEASASVSAQAPLIPREEMPDEIGAAVAAWNEFAARNGLAQVAKLTDARKSKIRARLKDAGGLEGWRCALARIEASCRWMLDGTARDGWLINIDSLIRESNFTKLMEGAYDRNKPAGAAAGPAVGGNGFAAILAEEGGFQPR